MKSFFYISFFIFLTFISCAPPKIQPEPIRKIIKGVVSDKTGPLPGTLIKVKNTERTTSTDWDGKFEIEVKEGEILFVSSPALVSVEITIDSKNFYNIMLYEWKPPMSKKMKRQIRKNKGIIEEW